MQKAFYALFDFDERAERSEMRDLAFDSGADRETRFYIAPRIFGEVLIAERYFLFGRVDLDYFNFDRIARFQHFVSVVEALGPRKVGYVDEAFDAFFEFDERAEFFNVGYFSVDDLIYFEFRFDHGPRIDMRLFDAEIYLFGFEVEFQNFYFDAVADFKEFGRMIDFLGPRNV
ncbi:MAG: hypothetical protein ACD_47C00667G0001 [uncultured bacterium]|nr:MAG: hypothetical protein ACD_47C00667G0001 [uncultured bacterium]